MFRRTLFALAAGLALATPALAEEAARDTRPTRWLVGLPAGSGPDILTRLLADRLAPLLGRAIVIENRPGAAGNLAARALARACRLVVERAAPGGLFLTGGSTARACLLALGVSGLRLEREPLPGIAAGVALGGRWDGRAVITKSGGFGAPDAVRRLVRPRSPSRISLPTARSVPPVA